MASNEWLVRKLHEQDKKIEALSRGGTGVGHTSIAPGENLTVISDNGEVVLGAGGVEHVDGPTPATPSAPSLKLGFGTIETTWDGTFAEGEDEDGVPLTAPVDFDVVEVHCSTDPEEEEWGEDTMRGQIKTREGGTITVGGFDVDDEVFVCLIALAKTGKRSAPSATASLVIEGLDFSALFNELDAANATIKNAGEILVTEQDTLNDKLADAFGQIEDAIVSANGKNVVHYEDAPPTVADPGVEGDTWFVGQFGRTEQLLATNIALNPSFTTLNNQIGTGTMNPSSGTAVIVSADWAEHGTTALELTPTATNNTTAVDGMTRENTSTAVDAGKTFTISANIHLDAAQTGTLWSHPRRIVVRTRYGGFTSASYAYSDSAPNEAGTHRVSVTFTLQPNTEWWYFMLTNGSSTVPVYWDSIMIEEGAGSGTYFDGDTVDGETVDDPHYRWTGTPHASTSEKYLPAVEASGSDAWQIKEQYKFTGGAWVQVELNHQVISSMDVGKLVAGSAAIKEAVVQKLWADVVVAKMAVAEQFIGENAILTGAVTAPKITASEELWAKIAQFVRIRAEHIESDAIDGMVITGANIRTSATGARVQLDAGGVRVFDDSDNARTQLSPFGNTFKGEVEAETLVVNGGAELKSADNTLAQGAKLTLAAGVTDPTAPPTVQPYWDSLEFTPTEGRQYYGLAWAGGKYWTFEDDPTPAGNDFLVSIDPATGELGSFIPMTDNFWAAGGVTAIGSELFMLGRKTGVNYKYFVRVYSTAGNFLREWEYAEVGWSPSNPLKYRPGIGNDGANIVIAHCYDTGQLAMRTYNKSTGSQIGATVSDGGDSTKSDITGVYVGNADWGRKLATIAKKSNGKLPSFNPTTGVYDGASTQFNAAETESVGVVFHDGKFHTLAQSGKIHEYAAPNMGDDSNDWWATYRWSVDADNDGTNDSTSRIGPVKRFTWPNRSKLRFLGAPLPAGVGYITPSIARKSTTPSRTDFRTPNFSVYVGKSQAWYNSLPTDWQSGPAPSGSNDFPTAEPSTLVSASSTFQVNGDGSGRWGPLTFNPDGTMTSSAIPSWVPITTFKSGFGPQVWGDVPGYRIWPDGKVEWRGVVAGTMSGSSSMPILAVPAEARPGRPKNKVAAVTGAAVWRVEFGATADPGSLLVYPDGSSRSWVSLDELYYYLP